MSDCNTKNTGCCDAEIALELDVLHDNRPGLPALSFRLGHWSDFVTRMMTRLPNQRVSEEIDSAPPLGRLTYRGDDDFTIALIDACAALMDVLSFYQERIANEGFVRTAIERRSVLEMTRSIGYELRPGVAAGTLLTFVIEDVPGVPEQVLVPHGTQIMSIPKKDEKPQIFETVEPLEARAAWNSIPVRAPWSQLAQVIESQPSHLFIAGGAGQLRPGDMVLLVNEGEGGEVAPGDRHVLQAQRVTSFPERGYTRVDLRAPHGAPAAVQILDRPRLYGFRRRTQLFGHNAPAPAQTEEVRGLFRASIVTPVRSVALSPTDRMLAASGFQSAPGAEESPTRKTLRLWSMATRTEISALNIYASVTALGFSPDGAFLAAGDEHGGLTLWDISLEEPLGSATPPGGAGLIIGLAVRTGAVEDTFDITTVDVFGQGFLWSLSASRELSFVAALGETPVSEVLAPPDPDRGLIGNQDGSTQYWFQAEVEPWPDEMTLADGHVDLATMFANLVPDSWALLLDPGRADAFHVEDVAVVHRTDLGLSARISRLTVDQSSSDLVYSLRETLVYVDSVELELAEVKIALPEPVQGEIVQTAGQIAKLEAGRTVIVAGCACPAIDISSGTHTVEALLPGDKGVKLTIEAADPAASNMYRVRDEHGFTSQIQIPGHTLLLWKEEPAPTYEAATVADHGADDDGLQRVLFTAPLRHAYDWRTAHILANVAPATHGETVHEVLGSGDGLQRNQRFTLRKPPLTYVTGVGGALQSTLDVRVNGVLWQEHESLLQLQPRDEAFMVRIEDSGATDVIFGDGRRGARLSSGEENVVAVYRSGLGPEGEVDAGQLELLKTRPLGVSEVSNPFPATGAAPPESREEARERAPRSVLVLGRVVSVQDYEDFTRSFPGVGKADVVELWDGRSRIVHLTVGALSGAPIAVDTALYRDLLAALDVVRDTSQPLIIQGYVPRYFGVCAQVLIDRRYEEDLVERAIHRHLAEELSFATRDFGQDITAAAVIALMHEVPGVIAVDLDKLHRVDTHDDDEDEAEDPDCSDPGPVTQRLTARIGRLVDGRTEGAELLLIDEEHINIKPEAMP